MHEQEGGLLSVGGWLLPLPLHSSNHKSNPFCIATVTFSQGGRDPS